MNNSEWLYKRARFRRIEALQSLRNKCAECGSTNNLEFDHIDPDTKEREMADAFRCSEDLFLKELKRCQLLCNSCHSRKTHTKKFCLKGHLRDSKNVGACGQCLECQRAYQRNRRAKLKKQEEQ